MAESTTITLRIGGNLNNSDSLKLLELIENSTPENGFELDAENRIQLVYWSVPFGGNPAIKQITDFCEQHGLPYRLWTESNGMIDGSLYIWGPRGSAEFLSNANEQICFTLNDLITREQKGITSADDIRDFPELPEFSGLTPNNSKTDQNF